LIRKGRRKGGKQKKTPRWDGDGDWKGGLLGLGGRAKGKE